MYPVMPQTLDEPMDDVEIGDAQLVPDGANDVETISNLRYIQVFISGKLIFPKDARGNAKEYCFGYEDLTDLGAIGEGAYGRVNKMLHNESGRMMAVKKVRIKFGKDDDNESSRSMSRLRREVEAIRSASDCPEIVCFYGVTFYEGDCLVCMELMDSSLGELYKIAHKQAGMFDERILGHIAVSVLKALSHLKNENKIIHRDIKPSNILLNLRGMIKLCDFGISGYLVGSVALSLEAGCRPYMAPERLMTEKGYDIRSDVWSLGITLEEVAIGEFPYPEFNENELFFQLQQVVYGDAPIMVPDVYSIQTVNFINSCLVKEPELRPNYIKLMATDYYKYYDKLEGTPTYVAEYLQKVLSSQS